MSSKTNPTATKLAKAIISNQNIDVNKAAQFYKEVQKSDVEAQHILNMLDGANIADFYKLQPVSGLTLLAVCADIDKMALLKAKKILSSERASFAAHKRHERTNKAKQAIREIWAKGNYSNRDLCAEQECAQLDISFSTARKALRNTPTP